MSWNFVRKSNQVNSQSLNLDKTKQYHVILRITAQDGTLTWVLSPKVEFDTVSIESKSQKNSSEKACCELLPNDCPIDLDNASRTAKISPREKMDSLYGAPQWPNRVGANSIYLE